MKPLEFPRALLGQTAANLWRHKFRSFLTMFGIAWGASSGHTRKTSMRSGRNAPW
jgi:hypothetical protein